jgi:hypothetical protein
MNKLDTQINLLRKSIKHWENNVNADSLKDASTSAEDCACCNEYNKRNDYDGKSCAGCPIYEATGLKFCRGTAYVDAHDIIEGCIIEGCFGLKGEELDSKFASFKIAAQSELEFLEGILAKLYEERRIRRLMNIKIKEELASKKVIDKQ